MTFYNESIINKLLRKEAHYHVTYKEKLFALGQVLPAIEALKALKGESDINTIATSNIIYDGVGIQAQSVSEIAAVGPILWVRRAD